MELPDRPLFVRTVGTDASLHDAAKVMVRDGIGSIFVREDPDSPITGVLTDRDIVTFIAEGCDPKSETVERVCGKRVERAPVNASRLELAKKMRVHGIRRLLLTNDEGEACGVVSLDDLLFELGAELSELSKSIVTARRNASGEPEPDL